MRHLITLFFAASCFTVVGQLPDYVPTDGLVGWFPCDSSLLDLTGTFTAEEFAFDGFFEGANGDTNGALGFDGESDFIRFEGNPVFGDSFSIGLWIKTEFGEHGPIVHVGRDDGSENNGFSLGIGGTTMNTPGDYLMAHFSGEGYWDVSSSVPYESWHHVCITWGSQLMTFYVQGDSVGSLSTTSSFTNPSNKLYFAAFSETDYEKYGGALDQIGLWNRALSSEEILGLYLGPLVMGCMDPEACNYDADANLDDGSCHFNCQFCHDGTVWDEDLFKCVVANPADINLDGCVQLNDLLDLLSAYGDCVGDDEDGTEDEGDGLWSCGSPLEYQGFNYETVQIGEQCWFAENLRTEEYANGDAIDKNLSALEWETTTSGASAVYGEEVNTCLPSYPNVDACNPVWSLNEYGRLYNWYAVNDSRKLCPNDWRVPSDDDWFVVANYLGGFPIAGGQMKTTYGWYNGGNGTNESGFSALPAGNRLVNGDFDAAGGFGDWWSSSPNGSNAWYRDLDYYDGDLFRSNGDPRQGFSVRCVQDTE